MPPSECPTCGGQQFVSLKHYGHDHKSSSRDLVPAGPIRWYFADYGAQLCYCPDCNPNGQTVAAKKRAQEHAA